MADGTDDGRFAEADGGALRARVERVAAAVVRLRLAPPGAAWGTRGVVPERPALPLAWAEAHGRQVARAGDLEVSLGEGGELGVLHHGVRIEASGRPRAEPFSLERSVIETRPGDTLPEAAQPAVSVAFRLWGDDGCFANGLRPGGLDQRHRRLANWCVDPYVPGHWRKRGNLYQAHPFVLVARPGAAWGLLLDTPWYSELDLGQGDPAELCAIALGGRLDCYLLAGPTPAAVLEQLTALTGRPALPPLWALGYHQSRWSYPDADTVRALVAEFRRREIPLGAVHLDIDHMHGYRVFTWDPERFPDPAALTAELRRAGVRTVAIADPSVKADLDYAVAADGLRRGAFLRGADGTPLCGWSWPEAAWFPDFARAEVRAWWGERQRALTDAGVEGIWNDMNEPSLVDGPYSDRDTRYHPFPLATPEGDGASHAELHNRYGAHMAQASREGLERAGPGRRPWVLTRSAFTGSQRHAATWTGDNRSTWEDLRRSIAQLCNLGLSGMAHCGADIGGFWDNGHGELFARWMELGALYPLMRGHTALHTRAQEPWAFGPQVLEAARRAIRLRYRLLPYLYTLAHRAAATGEPLLRPLFYDFPDEPGLYAVEDQFMLGPLLMAAPVCAPRQHRRTLLLPAGRWYDFWSGRPVAGREGYAVADAPPGRPPLFVRAGGLLTLGPVRAHTGEPLRELTVAAFGGAAGAWEHREDDGESADAPLARTPLALSEREDALVLDIGCREGDYRPAPRDWSVLFPLSNAPRGVLLDGRLTDAWVWRDRPRAAQLRFPDDGRAHRVEVKVG